LETGWLESSDFEVRSETSGGREIRGLDMGFDSPTSGVYLCVKVRSFSWFVERLDYFGDMNWGSGHVHEDGP
jgi:hypothetical protein